MSGPLVQVWIVVDNVFLGYYWVQQGNEFEEVREIIDGFTHWTGKRLTRQRIRWNIRLDAPPYDRARPHTLEELPVE